MIPLSYDSSNYYEIVDQRHLERQRVGRRQARSRTRTRMATGHKQKQREGEGEHVQFGRA